MLDNCNIRNATSHLMYGLQKHFPLGVPLCNNGRLNHDLCDDSLDELKLNVASSLFDIKFDNNDDLSAFLGASLDSDDINAMGRRSLLCANLLPLVGVGEDSLYLCDHLGPVGLGGFANFLEYDRYVYDMGVETASKAGLIDAFDDGYKPVLLNADARWLSNGQLVYGQLSLACLVLEDHIENVCTNLIHEKYPFDIDVTSYEAALMFSSSCDENTELFEAGRDKLMNEIKLRSDSHWCKYFNSIDAAIAFSKKTVVNNSVVELLFSNEEAMEHTSFETFVVDVHKMNSHDSSFVNFIETETAKMISWINTII